MFSARFTPRSHKRLTLLSTLWPPVARVQPPKVTITVTKPVVLPRRLYATPPSHIVPSNLSEDDYHALSDHTMETLLEKLEACLDELGDPAFEVDYSSGVLTLKLGLHGTYVINKQPPNKQIWLSSPISGPKRYDLNLQSRDWVYSRDCRALGELLNEELSDLFKANVDLALGSEVQVKVTERLRLHPS